MSQENDIHAHWIEMPTYGMEMDYAYTIFVCSHCGDSVDEMESFRMKCPHCGAIMDEEMKKDELLGNVYNKCKTDSKD